MELGEIESRILALESELAMMREQAVIREVEHEQVVAGIASVAIEAAQQAEEAANQANQAAVVATAESQLAIVASVEAEQSAIVATVITEQVAQQPEEVTRETETVEPDAGGDTQTGETRPTEDSDADRHGEQPIALANDYQPRPGSGPDSTGSKRTAARRGSGRREHKPLRWITG